MDSALITDTLPYVFKPGLTAGAAPPDSRPGASAPLRRPPAAGAANLARDPPSVGYDDALRLAQ
jgi:hypothetical protein